MPPIHRLCIINTYESEYNLVLKYFWPKQGIEKAEVNLWVRNNQTGGRKNFCAVETATIDRLIIKTHRLTKFPLCIHQDDEMGCYGRIIRSHAILNSRKFSIPDNICKVYNIAHSLMKFRTQINNSISKMSYSRTDKLKYNGSDQEAGNGETKCIFIIIPMIEGVEEVSKGCVIQLPRGSKTWGKYILTFVDDKRHYVNGNHKQTSKHILTAMVISVSSWNELLHFVGGALKTSKCACYLIKWYFDSNDSPLMQETKETLKITMHDETEMKSTQLQPNQVTTYLGVTSQVDGNKSTHTTILKQKAHRIRRKLNCCHMSHYYGRIHQLCFINPKLTYPLIASSMNKK